jgi:hypothetical protein
MVRESLFGRGCRQHIGLPFPPLIAKVENPKCLLLPAFLANDSATHRVYGRMKTHFLLITTTVLIALSIVAGAQGRQDRRIRRSANLNVSIDKVTSCGDLQITFDRRPAITEEAEMIVPASQVSTLRVQLENNGMYVGGWDRNEYSIKTCKAVPDDDPNASGTLRDIATTNSNGQISVSGPQDREWRAHLIISVPRLTSLDLQTGNGPLSLHDLAGTIRVRASNGPISLDNVGGSVEATTANGPIAVKRASGDQHLSAANGPIAVNLSGRAWDGPGLEVSTRNGPLAVSIPEGYGSAISIQTSSRSPISCASPVCAGVLRSPDSPTTLRFGNGEPVVRLSTQRGPLAIREAKE